MDELIFKAVGCDDIFFGGGACRPAREAMINPRINQTHGNGPESFKPLSEIDAVQKEIPQSLTTFSRVLRLQSIMTWNADSHFHDGFAAGVCFLDEIAILDVGKDCLAIHAGSKRLSRFLGKKAVGNVMKPVHDLRFEKSHVNRMTIRRKRRFVDNLRHGRVRVNRGVDLIGGEFLVERQAHFGDQFGGILTNQVRS